MKSFAVFILGSLFLSSAIAQDGIFLQVKDNPVAKLEGFGNMNTMASVNKDNSRLAITFISTETRKGTGIAYDFKSQHYTILMDLNLGKVIARKTGSTYQYIGDYLLKFDYHNDGKYVGMKDQNSVSKTSVLDPLTLEPIRELPIEGNQVYVTYFDDNYMIVQHQVWNGLVPKTFSTIYNYSQENGLQKIKQMDLATATLSPDKKLVIGSDPGMVGSSISAYDIATGKEVFKHKTKGAALMPLLTSKGEVFYGTLKATFDKKAGGMMADASSMRFLENTYVANIYDKKEKRELGEHGSWVGLSGDEKYFISLRTNSGEISLWDAETKQKISTSIETFFETKKAGLQWNVSMPFSVNDGKQFLVGYSSGIVSLFSIKEQKVTANLFFDKQDWAVVAKDGRMDGTAGAMDKLEWQELRGGQVVARTSLSSSFGKAYTPNLLSYLLNDEIAPAINLQSMVAQSPSVRILKPSDSFSSNEKEITVDVQGVPKGDPIAEILLYVNGKLTSGGERGFQVAGREKSFKVSLVPGENILTAKAVSRNGYESELDEIKVNYTGQTAAANLFVLAVGIDVYRNPAYNLNYANADAEAFVEKIRTQSAGIFENIDVKYITNADAIKDNLLSTLAELNSKADEQDVFVFYYAGHGVMSEGTDLTPSDFFLALYDVTQLYGNDDRLAQKGISAVELRNAFSQIKAQKQLIVLDACQSGGAVETFARRGAAEEKAMLQLARSAGMVLMASTGSEQYATEFEELGHGVFTYALLQGMNGQADGGTNDKKITVKELESYMNDAVPNLTEKHKGVMQFPRSWAKGQDFPLVIAP